MQPVLQVGGVLSVVSREMFKSIGMDEYSFGFEFSHESGLLASLMGPLLERMSLCESKLRSLGPERLCSLLVLRFDECVDAKAFWHFITKYVESLIELQISDRCMKERMFRAIAYNCKSLKVYHLF